MLSKSAPSPLGTLDGELRLPSNRAELSGVCGYARFARHDSAQKAAATHTQTDLVCIIHAVAPILRVVRVHCSRVLESAWGKKK